MKKGLKITVTVLEIIFALPAVLWALSIIVMIVWLHGLEFEEGIEGAVTFIVVFGLSIYACIGIVHSALLAAALHALRKSIGAKTKRPIRSITFALISGAAANLLYYIFLIWNPTTGMTKTLFGTSYLILWAICFFICLVSSIAIAVINEANNCRPVPVFTQGEPADPSDVRSC